MDRPLLIGEAPGRESIRRDPATLALAGQSGRALAAMAGMRMDDFLARFERVNLFLDPQPAWRGREAAISAELMLPHLAGRQVVMLGASVARAFAVERMPLYTWFPLAGAAVARVPHPSGRNRVLNSPEQRELVGATLRQALEACGA